MFVFPKRSVGNVLLILLHPRLFYPLAKIYPACATLSSLNLEMKEFLKLKQILRVREPFLEEMLSVIQENMSRQHCGRYH